MERFARLAAGKQEIWIPRCASVQQTDTETLANQTQISPGPRNRIHGGGSKRIVIAACTETAPMGMITIGHHIDRVVGHRRHGFTGKITRRRYGVFGLAQNMGHDPITYRSLIIARRCQIGHTLQKLRQRREGSPVVPAAQQITNDRLVVFHRCIKGNDHQRQHLPSHLQTPFGDQRRIRKQG
jgi:hypothetical protein